MRDGHRHRRRSLLVATLAALLLLHGAVGLVAAQSTDRVGGAVVVQEDETVDSVQATAGSVVVRGTVRGDVSGVAGTIHVTESGSVGGTVDAAGGTVRVDGTVDGDVRVGAGSVEIGPTAQIGGELQAGAGYVSIEGSVERDAVVGADTLVLGPNASIGGELRYDATTFERHPDATVSGGVVEDPSVQGDIGVWGGGFDLPWWLWPTFWLLASVLLGTVLLVALPGFSSGVASRVAEEPLQTVGVGLLGLVGVPVVLALVAITVVGIPLALLGALAYAFALWIGTVYGQFAIAAWAFERAGVAVWESLLRRWLVLLAGLLAFAVLGEVPILGGILELIALLLGLGAIGLGLRTAYQNRGSGSTTDPRQRTLDDAGGDASTVD